jgi:hypothetical protein
LRPVGGDHGQEENDDGEAASTSETTRGRHELLGAAGNAKDTKQH